MKKMGIMSIMMTLMLILLGSALLTTIILIQSTSTYAFKITPASTKIYYPQLEETGAEKLLIRVLESNSSKLGVLVEPETGLDDEVLNYVSTRVLYDHKGKPVGVETTLKSPPEELLNEGDNKIFIIISEEDDNKESRSSGEFKKVIRLASVIDIFKPYNKASLGVITCSLKSANSDSPVIGTIILENRGVYDLVAGAEGEIRPTNILDEKDYVKESLLEDQTRTFKTELIRMASGAKKKLSVKEEPLLPGVYDYNITIKYDLDNEEYLRSYQGLDLKKECSGLLRVGSPKIRIKNFRLSKYDPNGYSEISFDAELLWNQPVNAELFVDGEPQKSKRFLPYNVVPEKIYFDTKKVLSSDQQIDNSHLLLRILGKRESKGSGNSMDRDYLLAEKKIGVSSLIKDYERREDIKHLLLLALLIIIANSIGWYYYYHRHDHRK